MAFVPQRLIEHARRDPDKTAVVVNGNEFSYYNTARMALAVARALSSLGMDDKSVILLEAVPEITFVAACYGIHLLGAVHVPVEYRIPQDRVNAVADEVNASLILTGSEIDSNRSHTTLNSLLNRAEEFLSSFPWDGLPTAPDPDAPGEILFTTGTTGKSKGVVQSRRGIEAYLETINRSLGMSEDTVILVVTALNHAGGLHRLHMTIHAGGTIVLMDGLKDLKAFYSNIDRYKVNTLYLPPAGVRILLLFSSEQLARLDGQLHFVMTASAPFPETDREKMRALLPSTRLIEAYGSSEVGSVCNIDYNSPDAGKGCLGKPYDCVKIKIAENDIIQIRTPMIMLCYLNEPELTASVFRDGWFVTSDRGYLDENGYLYFLGRGDDVINVGGKKIAPTEVEDAVLRCSGVRDCACTSVADPVAGTSLRLLVCMEEGADFSPRAIANDLRRSLEDYKIPSRIERVDSIPRTFNGKIDRKKLRETSAADR